MSSDATDEIANFQRALLKESAKKLKAGDQDAFQSIFIILFADNLAFAFSLLGQNIDSAKKVTAETFFLLWAKHADFDSLENIESFLLTTLKSNCLNYLRHCRSVGERLPYEMSEQYSSTLPKPLVAKLLLFARNLSFGKVN